MRNVLMRIKSKCFITPEVREYLIHLWKVTRVILGVYKLYGIRKLKLMLHVVNTILQSLMLLQYLSLSAIY